MNSRICQKGKKHEDDVRQTKKDILGQTQTSQDERGEEGISIVRAM